MIDTMQQVMDACNNHFVQYFLEGNIEIENGALIDVDVHCCAYVYITGSAQHNGLYRVEQRDDNAVLIDDDAPDETFSGCVYLLAPPRGFINLCADVAAWVEKNPVGGLQSESFGAYSYSRASGAHGAVTWQEQHAERLRVYRRMYDDLTEVSAC